MTYKPKSALQDVVRALGGDLGEITKITTMLPKEFDDITVEDHRETREKLADSDPKVRAEAYKEASRYPQFYEYWEKNPNIVETAFKLIGKIRTQGTHAGGLIIADRPIDDLVPFSFLSGNWTSQWTEGRRLQLSKFGLVKFDILGIKTVYYVYRTGQLVKQTRGIDIDWTEMNPIADPPFLGHETHPDGTRKIILMNDPLALQRCNELKTDSVFQIESTIQKGIIRDGGVRSFWDLVVYNALGRPGPIDCIPEFVARRDDPDQTWKEGEDPRVVEILKDTFGVITYQEQLQAMWTILAGFTVTEAESARKIIAKKWLDKLAIVEDKWKRGATRTIGEKAAYDWWEKMHTFGRYAFNKSHSMAYSIVTYQCLYLKSHYPAEWWAAVMSECKPDKLPQYMSAARMDGVEFGGLDAWALSKEFSVKDNKVIPGLQMIKGIGDKAAEIFTDIKFGPTDGLDEMVQKTGKKKNIYERLIKLGAFDSACKNRRGLWNWYQYMYCADVESKTLRQEIDAKFAISPEKIQEIRQRHIQNWVKDNPKKKKIPKKVENYTPPKQKLSIQQVLSIYNDYTILQRLYIEKDLLGYYWTSPLSAFEHDSKLTIDNAKISGVMEIVVEMLEKKLSKKNRIYYILHVTDDIQKAKIFVWEDVADACSDVLRPGQGLRLEVIHDEERDSFRIANDTIPAMLRLKDNKRVEVQKEEIDDGPLVPEGTDMLW